MLDLVDGNRMFMQGYSTLDLKDNLVRVLDIIRGIRLDDAIGRIGGSYDNYLTHYTEKPFSALFLPQWRP